MRHPSRALCGFLFLCALCAGPAPLAAGEAGGPSGNPFARLADRLEPQAPLVLPGRTELRGPRPLILLPRPLVARFIAGARVHYTLDGSTPTAAS